MNASTNNAIALPFENAIAVGDTFITVQSYGSFVDANSPASKELVSDANKLVGVEVYSRTGNTLAQLLHSISIQSSAPSRASRSTMAQNSSRMLSSSSLPTSYSSTTAANPLLICARLKTTRAMLLQLLRQARQQPNLLRLHSLLHLPLTQMAFLTRILYSSTSSLARH